jgi:hypothetical protein
MRTGFKIIAFLFVTVLCCNVLVPDFKNTNQGNPVKNETESFLSVAPANEGSQAIEARNLTSLFSSIPEIFQKNKKEISSALIASALSGVNHYTGYIYYASCLIVRVESTDLIFPSHFFW